MDIISVARILFVLGMVVFCGSLYVSHVIYPKNTGQSQVTTQRVIILLIHFLGNYILIANRGFRREDFVFYIFQVGLLLISWGLIYFLLKDSHKGLWHAVEMLAVIGILMVTRLDYDLGIKQGMIFGVALLVSILVALVIKYIDFLPKLTYVYYVLALGLLILPNTTTGGANNWFSIGGYSFQPSEMSKVFFLMFLAAFFAKPINHLRLAISAAMTLVLLLIFVYQRDLGGALIFYLVYITIAYLASNKVKYFVAGLLGGGIGGTAGYYLFSHVRTRVIAWRHPFDYIDNQGYQVTQSLFAISAGGWFGKGFTQGMPTRIPVVVSDFIYAAIAEEFGNIFGMCLLLVFVLIFVMIAKMAIKIDDLFDTILVFGIGIMFMIQTFLIVGGVIKLIPSTGVTLPLISYGGSSLVMVLMMIGMVQGLQSKHIKEEGGQMDGKEK